MLLNVIYEMSILYAMLFGVIMILLSVGYKIEMPGLIERSVRRQNIEFLHNRTQFSTEYFQFMKKLVISSSTSFHNVSQQHLSKVRPILFSYSIHTLPWGTSVQWCGGCTVLLWRCNQYIWGY